MCHEAPEKWANAGKSKRHPTGNDGADLGDIPRARLTTFERKPCRRLLEGCIERSRYAMDAREPDDFAVQVIDLA